MVKSCCVEEKKQTECVEPPGYKKAKNGRLMFFCIVLVRHVVLQKQDL